MILADQKANTYSQYVSAFKGLNQLPVKDDEEVFSSENMVFDLYPVMSVRKGRTTYATVTGTPQGIITAKNKLAWVSGNTLYYDGNSTGLTGLSSGQKSMVEFWGKIFIFPDAKYYDISTHAHGSIGTGTYPATGSCPDMNYVCVHNNRIWGVKGNYIYASSNGYALGKPLTITCTYTASAVVAVGNYYITEGSHYWAFNLATALAAGDILVLNGYTGDITVNGVAKTAATEVPAASGTKLEATITYGTYGWTQWYDANGGVDDNGSFYQEVASDGDFTGIASWDDRIVALKERCHHEIQGAYPSAFALSTISKFGTLSHYSIQEVNSKLFYVSSTGVFMYAGGLENDYSRKLNEIFTGAVAGTDGIRYYLCLNNGGSSKKLYVYNAFVDMWTEEDALDINSFCLQGGKLYALCTDGKIIIMNDPASTEVVEWSFTFSDYSTEVFDDTKIARLILKIKGESGSAMTIQMSIDGGEYATLKAVNFPNESMQTINTAIKGRGKEHLFYISGTGKIQVFGYLMIAQNGGDNIV